MRVLGLRLKNQEPKPRTMCLSQRINILILLLLLGSTVAAQTGTVTGEIRSSDGAPAQYVNTGIKGTTRGAVANERGVFVITGVPAGPQTLLISHIGLETKAISINVFAGDTTRVPVITLSENAQTLREVVISGNADKNASAYVSKVPLKSIENPQVYHVIGREALEQQQLTNLEDAMRNAPGVSIIFPATGRATDGGTYYTSRGFTTNAALINGVAGSVLSNPDASNIERIEILKGPSATLFGSSLTSFGGAINVITKTPYDSLGGEVALTAGSWSLQRMQFDVNTPLNQTQNAAFRINGAYHYQQSFQDYGFVKRLCVSPSFSYRPNSRLSFVLVSNFSNIKSTLQPWFYADSATTGVNSADKLGIDYMKYYFPGDLYVTTRSANVMGTMNYKLSPVWNSQTILSSSTNNSQGPLTYLWYISDTSLTRENQTFQGTTTQLNVQQNFVADANWLGMRHRFVAGADYYQNYQNSTYTYFAGVQDTVFTNRPNTNYMDYNASLLANATPMYFFGSYTGIQRTQRTGLYASEVVNVFDNLILNLALRYDFYTSDGYSDPLNDTILGSYKQSGLSPKAGLVYQLLKNRVALFANYQNGLQNVNGRDFEGNVFQPQRANQYEAGVKFGFFDNRLAGSVSYYNIEVTNTVRNDPEHPLFSIQDGTQRSKGIEADVQLYGLHGFSVSLGYGYNDNVFTKAAADVQGRRPVESGPAHLGNAWISYRAESGRMKGFGAGFGGNSASRKFMTNSVSEGTFSAPAYVVMNAAVFYQHKNWGVNIAMNNITSEKYWIGWASFTPQAPREISGTVSWRF